jgi:hypothetical protein
MMYRTLGAVALLTMAIAAPMQDVAAQDPVGGAILGGAAGKAITIPLAWPMAQTLAEHLQRAAIRAEIADSKKK